MDQRNASHPVMHLVAPTTADLPGTAEAEQGTRPGIVFQPHVEAVDRRPRRLTVEACQATEIVAHAMEYLSDSRELPSGKVIELDQNHPDVFALLLLMEARYNIFVSCPVIERRKNTLGALFKGKERRRRP